MANNDDNIGQLIVELLADERWQGNLPDSDRTTWFNAVCNAAVDIFNKGATAEFAVECAQAALQAINRTYGEHQSI